MLLLVFITPLLVNFWVEQQFEASKVWLARSLIWLLALVWVSGRLAGVPQRQIPYPIPQVTAFLAGVIILASTFSPTPFVAWLGSLERQAGAITQLSYLLLFWIAATTLTPDLSHQIIRLMIFTAVPITALGLAQAAGWQPQPVLTDARTAITTTLGRSNFTGAYLALLVPLTLGAAQTTVSRSGKVAFGMLAALEIGVIGLTRARAAGAAAVVGVVLLVWLQIAPRRALRWRWATGLTGLAAGGGFLIFLWRWGAAAGGSIAARLTIWQASLHLLWPQLWLGYGADTLDLYFPAVYPPELVYYQGRGIAVDRAHNWLLDWSLSYGVVATAAVITLLAGIGWLGWGLLQKDGEPHFFTPGSRVWIAAALAAVGGNLAGNLFLFEVVATAIPVWVLLAVVVSAASPSPSAVPGRPAFSPVLGWVVTGVGLILVGAAIGWANINPLLADAAGWRGTQAYLRGDFVTAADGYAAAAARQRQRAEYHLALGLSAAQLGEQARAEAAAATAILLRPGDPAVYVQLAKIIEMRGLENPENILAAYAAYDRAIALAPTIALTYQQHADLALRAGDLPTAIVQAGRAVDLDATDGVSYGILGWALLADGRPAEALAAFEQAVRWEPQSADFYLGLATAQLQQDKTADAQASLATSLALDPNYPPALELHEILSGP